MARKQPKNTQPPEIKKWSDQPAEREIGGTKVIVQTRQYRLITPLFGGGVEAGVNDPITLIRGTEIRGQLRFWWRAIRGWSCGDGMKDREDELWGTASDTQNRLGNKQAEGVWQAAVQIEVEVQNPGRAKKPFKPEWNKTRAKISLQPDPDIPEYAAFPLRPTDDVLKAAQRAGGPEHVFVEDVREGVVFLLHLSFPQVWQEDIEAALWAWEIFGGVGARTRRGFGALLLEKIDGHDLKDENLPLADAQKAREQINARLSHYLAANEGKSVAQVPHLETSVQMRVLGPWPRPADAWQQLMSSLRAFRQQRFDFRLRRFSPFGKSLWPEANALRRRLHPHERGSNTSDTFPRAAFGLPIVFHLAHEKPSAKTITLQGTKDDGERWASRLILKPLPCQGKRFLGLAIVLDGSELPEENLALMLDGKQWKTISPKQTALKAGELPAELKKVIGNKTDILLAFLNYLKEEK